jgi:murein DD-endopeptidase MepM/ murein hydrolase activator NlpD
MGRIRRYLFTYLTFLNFILGLSPIQPIFAQDTKITDLRCYIKSGYQLFNDENQSSSFDGITPNGKTICRSVGKNMYLIKFRGRSLYVQSNAIDKEKSIPLNDTEQPQIPKTDNSASESTIQNTIRLIDLRSEENTAPTSDLVGQKVKVLPKMWVPVRTSPNQSSRFECPENIVDSYSAKQAKTICGNVESIDSSTELTLTGQRVFDKDNKNWYVEATFKHDGRTFSGWFDEKQTTLNPNEENIRSVTAAERTQNAWGSFSEIGLSSISEYKLDSTEIGYNERAKMTFAAQSNPKLFTPVRQAEPEQKPKASSSAFAPPVCGCIGKQCYISSGYGPRKPFRTSNGNWASTYHRAWDIAAGKGTPILAVADGKITFAGWKSGYGKTIEVSLGKGLIVRYSHLSSYTISSGRVKKGQQIAKMGDTGNATGPHLDIGFRLNGVSQNPSKYISSKPSFLNQSCGAVR